MKKFIPLIISTMILLTNTNYIVIQASTSRETIITTDAEKEGYNDGVSDSFYYFRRSEAGITKDDVQDYIDSYLDALDFEKDVDYYFIYDDLTQKEKNLFEKTYKIAYREAFLDEYEEIEEAQEKILNAYELGEKYGYIYGASMAIRDYEIRRIKDSQRAYSEFNANENLGKIMDITVLDQVDSKSFMETFPIGFEQGYNESYNRAFDEEKILQGNYLNLYLQPIEFTYTDLKNSMVSSDVEVASLDALSIDAQANTFYDDVYLNIVKDNKKDSRVINGKQLITNPYALTVYNTIDSRTPRSVTMHKDFQISFPSIDNDRAGIYKFENSDWIYQYTEIDEKNLNTTIKGESYSGGIYAVLVDYDFNIVSDINLSWAYEELYTYLRRGYIVPDSINSYNPNASITRGEFANLIYKNSYNSDYANYESKQFSDSELFGNYGDAINYCYNKGYLLGVSDSEFDPYGLLTYYQVETIMGRVLGTDFNFETINQSMMNDKFKKSKITSGTGKNQNISRDEAVYMFYYLYN